MRIIIEIDDPRGKTAAWLLENLHAPRTMQEGGIYPIHCADVAAPRSGRIATVLGTVRIEGAGTHDANALPIGFDESTPEGILCVEVGAPWQDIKDAYRREAKRWHPDINHADGAAQRMAVINAAFATLEAQRA